MLSSLTPVRHRRRPARLHRGSSGHGRRPCPAARLASRERSFNLLVANVPGPREPRFLLGRRLRSIYQALPLARGQALSVAAVSCAGRLCSGFVSAYGALADPELLARCLTDSLAELEPLG